jgi:hypothetical protein
MALTEEQIKNLKKGQEVYIKANFLEIGKSMNESLYVQINRTDGLGYGFEIIGQSCNIPIEDIVIPSSPKHDPCRPFRKGDKVKLTKWNGRICEKFFRAGIHCGENLTVVRDEDCFLNVTVRTRHGIEKAILSPFLELVTPVEELEPYYIEETEYEFCVTIMVGERKDSPAIYHKRMHPHAKEAAEAECERLNAEYRKEQNND